MIDAVVFDFDGTLADTSELIIKSFQTVYKKFLGEEKPEEVIRGFFGEPLKVTIKREFPQSYEEVFKEYRQYQSERFDTYVRLFDNAKKTLKYLKSKNIKTAVVTSRIRESVINAMKTFNIEKYFDEVVAVNDTVNHKPHPEPLIKAIGLLNVSADRVLFAGDSRFDMECAVRAGITPVLAGWHTGSDELAKQYNVKYVINNLYEITGLIEM